MRREAAGSHVLGVEVAGLVSKSESSPEEHNS